MKELAIDLREIEEIVISNYHWDHTGGLSDLLKANRVALYVPVSCRGVHRAKEVVAVKEPTEIREDIFLTLVVIAGCSHPRVRTILEGASQFGKPLALIGGCMDSGISMWSRTLNGSAQLIVLSSSQK